MDLQDTCSETCRIASGAGDFIRKESWNFTREKVEEKGLHDFFSYVDVRSEEMLADGLSRLIPGSGILAEEGTASHSGEEYLWVIDPLDGTTNFIHGVGPYCISVALKHREQVLIGVVYDVPSGEMFYGWKDGGAWLNGKKIQVSGSSTLNDSLIAVGFPCSDHERLAEYLRCLEQLVRKSHGVRRFGSAAIDLAYVACGRFEGYIEYALYPWDVMAGTLLVREAGGTVSDFKGSSERMTGKEILAANPAVHSEMLGIVRSCMDKG